VSRSGSQAEYSRDLIWSQLLLTKSVFLCWWGGGASVWKLQRTTFIYTIIYITRSKDNWEFFSLVKCTYGTHVCKNHNN
jgi:hypothetical protein